MMNYSEIFVAIAAEPWQTVVDFYAELLDLEPYPYSENRYAEFRIGDFKLGIFQPNVSHQQEFQGRSGSFSLCLEVEDLAAAIAHLKKLGGRVDPEITQTSHGRECYAYDPVENRLILHES